VSWEDQADGSHWNATVRVVTKDGWRVDVVLVEQKSGVAVRELRLTPASPRRVPKGGVTRRLLEKIELTELRAAASEAARDHFGDEDRAAADMEVLLGGLLFARDAKGTEITGRLDIRYATAAGRHVIVELKRYSVKEEVEIFRKQGLKYYTALKSILEQQGRSDEAIEIVFVLGHKPRTTAAGGSTPDDHIATQFAGINGRYVLYDQLIENARRQYEDYLDASVKAHALDELLAELEPVESENA
jgi:hypothetical protein